MPTLLPAQPGPLQGQEARLYGASSQADLEAGKRASVQLQGAGEAINPNEYPLFKPGVALTNISALMASFRQKRLAKAVFGQAKELKVLKAFEDQQYFLSSVESLSDLEK